MWLFDFITSLFKPKHKHKINYSYIPPQTFNPKNGWQKVNHPSNWVKNRLIHVPEYEPEQGVHYYPYCRGRHFEYSCEGTYPIYRRKIHRH
jgi:hypothetical protein